MKDSYGLPDRYTFKRALGKGGMGEVFEVYDSVLNQNVALKILHTVDPNANKSLAREFDTLSHLSHRNLVKVYDFSLSSLNIPYFTMELTCGNNLKEYFKHDSNMQFFPEVAEQIINAIAYLHKQGIYHKDVKPENIIVLTDNSNQPTVKLLDFGLVTAVGTHDNLISGTFRFLPIEAITSKQFSASTDIYSLGMSFIECLTQEEIPDALKIDEDFYRSSHSTLSKIFSNYRLNNPSSLSSFIINLANTNQRTRPSNAVEALALLNLIIHKPITTIDPFEDYHFVGRNSELNAINSFMNTNSYEKRLLILKGQRGIGKKSILSVAVKNAQLNGSLVIDFSQNISIHSSISTFIEIFTSYLSNDKKKQLLDKHNNILSSLTDDRLDESLDSALIIYDNIIQSIHELSNNRPIFICFANYEILSDDLIHFIHHLVYESNYLHSNIKIILAINDDILLSELKGSIFNKLCSFSYSSKLDIQPFKNHDITALTEAYFNTQLFTDHECKELLNRTNGVPIFLIELIRHLVITSVIYFSSAAWHLDRAAFREFHIPGNIEELIHSLYEKLSDNQILFLQFIAYWGEPISLHILSGLTNHDLGIVKQITEELVNKGILSIDTHDNIYYKNQIFGHAIIKNTPPDTKSLINKSIAIELESSHVGDPIRIASHYIDSENIPKAIEYSLIASKHLISFHERYDCYNLLNRARNLLSKINNVIYYKEILSILAPIEFQLGMIDKAKDDYFLLLSFTDDNDLKALYYKQLALIYDIFLGDKENAGDYYKQALDISKSTDVKSEILLSMGNYYGDDCRDYLLEAAELSKNRNLDIYATALSRLLYNYKISGNIRDLHKTEKELGDLLDNVSAKTQKEIYYNMYLLSFYEGNYENAKHNINQLIQIDNDTDNELGKIKSLSSLGGLHFIQGDFLNQIKSLNIALDLCCKFNAYLSALTIYSNLALAYLYLAKYGDVLKVITNADNLLEEYNITEIPPYYPLKPAKLYLQLGDYAEEEYINYLNSTYRIATQTKYSIILGHMHLIKSQYHFYRLNYESAFQEASNSLTIFEDLEDNDDIVDALAHISIYLTESNMIDLAKPYIKRARNIYDDIHCQYLEPLLYYAEGIYSRICGREDTVELLTTGLDTSIKLGTRELTWQFYRELAIYHVGIGAINNALSFYRDSVATIKEITESIESDELKNSYLSLPFRRRVFDEIKSIKKRL